MNWILIAILLLALGMMVWPILLLKPSARQKQQAQARMTLIKQGIKITPQAPKLPTVFQQTYADIASSVQYALINPQSQLSESHLALKNPDTQQWFWPEKRPPAACLAQLLTAYQNLPDWCLAVQQDRHSSSIFALESQVDQTRLHALLEMLNQASRS